MRRFFHKHNNKILSIVGVISFIGLIMLLGNNVIENRINEQNEMDNEIAYTTTTTTTATQTEVELIDKVALPDVIYTVVGQPVVIRYMNITTFNTLDDFEMKVESGGRGKAYNDRWEYTPQKEETVTVSFLVTDKAGEKVNESTHVIQVKESTKKALSVLVIGDSTIEAGKETEKLLALAKKDNRQLKLLGTLSQDWLKDKNNRHEGRGGWKANTYVEKAETANTDATNAFYNPETGTFDFSYYMDKQGYDSVDCVCLQLGINDVFGAPNDSTLETTSVKTYLNNMDKLVQSIHAYNPDIKIVWNLILPGSAEQEKFQKAYEEIQTADRYKRNTYLANLEIIEHVAELENVYVAPTNAALNTFKNMEAGGNGAIHPAQAGYYDIGQVIYNCITAIC